MLPPHSLTQCPQSANSLTRKLPSFARSQVQVGTYSVRPKYASPNRKIKLISLKEVVLDPMFERRCYGVWFRRKLRHSVRLHTFCHSHERCGRQRARRKMAQDHHGACEGRVWRGLTADRKAAANQGPTETTPENLV